MHENDGSSVLGEVVAPHVACFACLDFIEGKGNGFFS